MSSVTGRIKQVKQPRGGYVSPRSMTVSQRDDGHPSPLDHKVENLHAALVGMSVDYLTRLALGSDPVKAFEISLLGAKRIGSVAFADAEALIGTLSAGRVDSDAIIAACRLAGYDVGFRAGPAMYNPDAVVEPDGATIEHIKIMVDRSIAFFADYGPVVLDGFTFPGAYTDLVATGDGDFLTSDTLWDFKVSVNGPTKDHTLQLIMYFLMGKASGQPEFDGLTRLGVFNPRLNAVHLLPIADLSDELLDEIAHDVIGY